MVEIVSGIAHHAQPFHDMAGTDVAGRREADDFRMPHALRRFSVSSPATAAPASITFSALYASAVRPSFSFVIFASPPFGLSQASLDVFFLRLRDTGHGREL